VKRANGKQTSDGAWPCWPGFSFGRNGANAQTDSDGNHRHPSAPHHGEGRTAADPDRFFRAHDARGLNVFERPKEEGALQRFRIQWAPRSTQQFQGLATRTRDAEMSAGGPEHS